MSARRLLAVGWVCSGRAVGLVAGRLMGYRVWRGCASPRRHLVAPPLCVASVSRCCLPSILFDRGTVPARHLARIPHGSPPTHVGPLPASYPRCLLQGLYRLPRRAICPDSLSFAIPASVRLILAAKAIYNHPGVPAARPAPTGGKDSAARRKPSAVAHPSTRQDPGTRSPATPIRGSPAAPYAGGSFAIHSPRSPKLPIVCHPKLPNTLCRVRTNRISSLGQKDFGEEVAIFGSLAGIHKARI